MPDEEHNLEFEFEDGQLVRGEYSGDTTNFVPFTAFMTWLLENDGFPIDEKRIREAVKQCKGTLHFRPNNRAIHARARKLVGELLGVE